jgi:hypothetical protein
MNRASAPALGLAFALSMAVEPSARARLTQPITDESLIADMRETANNLPADPDELCRQLDEVYFTALRRANDNARPEVSAELTTELQSLALLRGRRHCTNCPKGMSCRKVASIDALAKTHDRLVAELSTCTPSTCLRLQASLLKNFIDLVRESPPESRKVAQAAREMVLVVSADENARTLTAQISRGIVPADVLLDLTKVALNRCGADDRLAASLLGEIASVLNKVSQSGARVSDELLRQVFAAVVRLITNANLPESKVRDLLDELGKIVSEKDLIRLGEIAKVGQDLKDPARWQSLSASIDIMTEIYPELQGKLRRPPVEPRSRDEYLSSLANIMNIAQLVELNRLRAAQHQVRLAPERSPEQKVLIVVRNVEGCEGGTQDPVCAVAGDFRHQFLIALGSTVSDVGLAEIPGEPEDVLGLATKALNSKDSGACDLKTYGSLCQRPYAGVVVLALRRQGAGAQVRIGWRVRDEFGKINGDPLWTAVLADRRHAQQAGFEEGVSVLHDQTLWKVVPKERPVDEPVVIATVPDAESPPPPVEAPVAVPPPFGRRVALASTALLNAGLPLLLDDSHNNDRLGATLAVADTLVLGAMAAAFWQARVQREAFERGETASLHGADQMYGLAISAALIYVGVKGVGMVSGFVLQRRKETR